MRPLYFLFILLFFSCSNKDDNDINTSNNNPYKDKLYSELDDGSKLAKAMKEKNVKEVLKVLERDISWINSVNEVGNTLLINFSSNYEMVKYLVEHGAEVNHQRDDGGFALYLAAQNGKYEIVKYLLENGADPNLRENDGYDALMITVEQARYDEKREACEKIAWLLIEYGADLFEGDEPENKRGSRGNYIEFKSFRGSLLTWAIASEMSDEFIQFLRDKGQKSSVFDR